MNPKNSNMAGKLLLRETVNDLTSVKMDISAYPAAVYLIMIDDGKRKATRRLVKN